jgi:hypothetical protein
VPFSFSKSRQVEVDSRKPLCEVGGTWLAVCFLSKAILRKRRKREKVLRPLVDTKMRQLLGTLCGDG